KEPARITRAVRREVAERDGEQCAFVSAVGERCPAREFLEFDHRQPRADGGSGASDNVRLLCRSPNRPAAEKFFGRAHVEEKIRRSRERSRVIETTREVVRDALVKMGFGNPDAKRAILRMEPGTWNRPAPELLREALRVLT